MTEFIWGRPSPEDQVRAAEGLGKFWEMGGRIVEKLKQLDNPPGWIGHTIKLQPEQPDMFPDSYSADQCNRWNHGRPRNDDQCRRERSGNSAAEP
ncbi:hypothetical protein [Arthrobacter globiformis]|uniref:hypothetical protein n=1 Tax=Arthrobacter globiformis TaxID=1665 RepID=UPI00278DC3FE|nr:hypothetical protein [Arthrobacter globiformis]MDQ0618644.1 hypothetical protein [Arthrobacter globiformis]